eukprot:32657_1
MSRSKSSKKIKFFSRQKSAGELAKTLEKQLQRFEQPEAFPDDISKTSEKITVTLSACRLILYGDEDSPPKVEESERLISELLNERSNMLVSIFRHLHQFEFEGQKDAIQVILHLLRNDSRTAMIEYISRHPEFLRILISGYQHPEIASCYGNVLRECIRYENLYSALLNLPDGEFYLFFQFVQSPNFDVASDAFITFKMLLTKHKKICAQFLRDNYEEVIINNYNNLIISPNYVTRRQSLKLLSEILLDREHFKTMMRYINDTDNLKTMMNLLRDKSAFIQFEAFHVFKVFVANPKKLPAVQDILFRNKGRLIEFLSQFQKDKDDEQFIEEKEILLNELRSLTAPVPPVQK